MAEVHLKRRSVAALAAACAVLAVSAGTAAAHTEVSSTSPRSGKSLRSSLSAASVTFSGPLRRGTLRVTGPGGTWSVGKGGRDPRNVRRVIVRLRGGQPAGNYRASWAVVAADGHHQSGSFRFKIRR